MKLAERAGSPLCAVQTTLAGLDQDDADALAYVIFRRLDLSSTDVSAFLSESDIEISDRMVRRHRQGTCSSCREKGVGREAV